MELAYDPAIPLLDVYSQATEPKPQRDICTPILTAASSTTAEAWKPPECLSTGGCTKKLRYKRTVECYFTRDTLRQHIWNHKWNKVLEKTTAESRVLFPSGKAIEIHRSFPPNFSGRKNSNFYKHPPWKERTSTVFSGASVTLYTKPETDISGRWSLSPASATDTDAKSFKLKQGWQARPGSVEGNATWRRLGRGRHPRIT